MAENHVSTRLPIARKPPRHRVDEGLVVQFLCHANRTHVLQTLWRGLVGSTGRCNTVGFRCCPDRRCGRGEVGPSGGLSEARKKELWEKWKAGESIRDIARAYRSIMPNGQKYEDWLKSRGEENSSS